MTALTSDRNTEYSLGDLLSMPVAAGSRIFAGALVCSNASGYAVRAADSAGLVFEGVATAQADNRNGAAGDVRVVVRRRGRYRLDCVSSLDQSAVSAQVYAVDDHSVGVASDVSHSVGVGVIDRVESADECWVSIDSAVLAGKAWSVPTTTAAATTTTTAA